MDVIPNFWSFKDPVTAKLNVLVFKPYSGPNQTRSFNTTEFHDWELSNDDSSHEDFLTIKDFWRNHYPGVQFYLHDPQLDETRVYEIDSNFAQTYNHGDSYSWAFRITEAYPYTVITGPPP